MASSLIFANDPPLGFSNNQLEFLAEDEIVTVVPNFEGDKLQLIMGDFGPFKPLKPVGVPLWLALSMKKKQMCSIQPPQWLHIGTVHCFYFSRSSEFGITVSVFFFFKTNL